MQTMKALKTALIRIMQLPGNSAANGLACRPYATGLYEPLSSVRVADDHPTRPAPCGRGAGSQRAVHGTRSQELGRDEASHAGL